MRFSPKHLLASVLMALSLTVGCSTATYATATVQISPTKVYATFQPGQTYQESIQLYNPGDETLEYTTTINPYSIASDDEEYNTPDTVTANANSAIVDWITVGSTGTGSLEAGGEVTITYTISVPQDATPGGQYAAVAVQQVNDDDVSGTVGVKSVIQVAQTLYATIAGDIDTAGAIASNNISSFFFTSPITATSLVENTGNVHSDATYILQVFPLFSDEEVYTNEEDPDTYTILPNTRRLITQSWDGAPALGIFRVQQTVKFAGTESVTSKLVVICPMWLLILVIFLIIFLVVWFVVRGKSRKSKKSKKSGHHNSAQTDKSSGHSQSIEVKGENPDAKQA